MSELNGIFADEVLITLALRDREDGFTIPAPDFEDRDDADSSYGGA